MTEERDFLAEMDTLIAEATSGSGWVAGVVAEKLYNQLVEKDTDLLDGWLDLMAKDTLRRAISGREHARRTRERNAAEPGRFSDAAREFAKGNDEGGNALLGMFSVTHVVSDENLRKRAGEMTGADHLFVAGTYQDRGKRAMMEAAFHRAIAKRVKDQRTDEVFGLEEYEAMHRSLTEKK